MRGRDPHWLGGTRGSLKRPLFSLAAGHALPASGVRIGGLGGTRCRPPRLSLAKRGGGGARCSPLGSPRPDPPRPAPLALTGRVGGPGACRGAEVEGHGADRGTASGGPRGRRLRAPAAGPATNKTGRTRRFSAAAKALPGGAGGAW